MTIDLFTVLLILALILCIVSAVDGRVPLWASVFVLIVSLLVKFWA